MTIRWGVNPIAWINDDMPSLGAGTTLETILGDAQAIGFAGIERGHLFPTDPAVLAPVLAGYKLALAGAWYGANLLLQDAKAEIAALAPHLEMLERLGSEVFIIAETSNAVHGQRDVPFARSPRLAEDDWARFGERLSSVAQYLESRGMRTAYHHHLGTVVETAEDLERFLEVTDPAVGLVLDTGHAWYGGIDPVQVILAHSQRIAHVHCKDVRPDRHAAVLDQGGSFLDGVVAGMFTVPGDGAIDFAPVLAGLWQAGYKGWIVIEAEQDPKQADPKTFAQLGLATLQHLARPMGLIA